MKRMRSIWTDRKSENSLLCAHIAWSFHPHDGAPEQCGNLVLFTCALHHGDATDEPPVTIVHDFKSILCVVEEEADSDVRLPVPIVDFCFAAPSSSSLPRCFVLTPSFRVHTFNIDAAFTFQPTAVWFWPGSGLTHVRPLLNGFAAVSGPRSFYIVSDREDEAKPNVCENCTLNLTDAKDPFRMVAQLYADVVVASTPSRVLELDEAGRRRSTVAMYPGMCTGADPSMGHVFFSRFGRDSCVSISTRLRTEGTGSETVICLFRIADE